MASVWIVVEHYYAETHMLAAYLTESEARAAADAADRLTYPGKHDVEEVPLGVPVPPKSWFPDGVGYPEPWPDTPSA